MPSSLWYQNKKAYTATISFLNSGPIVSLYRNKACIQKRPSLSINTKTLYVNDKSQTFTVSLIQFIKQNRSLNSTLYKSRKTVQLRLRKKFYSRQRLEICITNTYANIKRRCIECGAVFPNSTDKVKSEGARGWGYGLAVEHLSCMHEIKLINH